MDKIVGQSKIGKYTVLYLEPNPNRYFMDYRKYKIKDREYEPVPVYDAKNTIAIITDEKQFVDETVEYI